MADQLLTLRAGQQYLSWRCRFGLIEGRVGLLQSTEIMLLVSILVCPARIIKNYNGELTNGGNEYHERNATMNPSHEKKKVLP